MIALYFIVLAVCIGGYFLGEVIKQSWLRVLCMLFSLVLVCLPAYATGRLGASLDTSMTLTESVDRFLQAAVDRLDAGDEARVHDELRRLSADVNWTKESGAFIDQFDASSQRLQPDADQAR